MEKITQRRLKELLRYDPECGLFYWRVADGRNRIKVGQIAGNVSTTSRHRHIMVDCGRYLASHLAVFYMTGKWPRFTIDHIDCNPINDRWNNLREATQQQQQRNRPTYSSTGYKGVSSVRGGFSAQITIDKKHFYLGFRKTAVEAHQLYREAATRYGEFGRL